MVYGGEFLVGYDGHLFHIETDLQVGEARAGYDACGCGADIAFGSLHSTAKIPLSVDDRVAMALRAAAEFSAGVRAPFVTLSTATAAVGKLAA